MTYALCWIRRFGSDTEFFFHARSNSIGLNMNILEMKSPKQMFNRHGLFVEFMFVLYTQNKNRIGTLHSKVPNAISSQASGDRDNRMGSFQCFDTGAVTVLDILQMYTIFLLKDQRIEQHYDSVEFQYIERPKEYVMPTTYAYMIDLRASSDRRTGRT